MKTSWYYMERLFSLILDYFKKKGFWDILWDAFCLLVIVVLAVPVSSFIVDILMSNYHVIDYKLAVCWFFICFAICVLFKHLEEKFSNQFTILMSKMAFVVLMETIVVFVLRLFLDLSLPIVLF